jgi:hypothetical protein
MYGDYSFDLTEVLKRAIKYFVEGFFVALSAYYIPQGRRLKMEEIFTIGLTAAATFAVLDMYAPSFAPAARVGSGFGIGANLVGFPN